VDHAATQATKGVTLVRLPVTTQDTTASRSWFRCGVLRQGARARMRLCVVGVGVMIGGEATIRLTLDFI
jgi:hypothetical protein